MSTPAQKKYFVAVTRPVIQSVIIEVQAGSYEEAADKAIGEASELSDAAWAGEFDQDSYGFDVAGMVEQDALDLDEELDLQDNIDKVKYLLLRGDIEIGEGAMLFQPWLLNHSSLFVADVCKDWLGDLQLLADEGAEGVAEWIESLVVDATPIPPEVIAKLPWLRQKRNKGMDDS